MGVSDFATIGYGASCDLRYGGERKPPIYLCLFISAFAAIGQYYTDNGLQKNAPRFHHCLERARGTGAGYHFLLKL
jgi:hypothetical protein